LCVLIYFHYKYMSGTKNKIICMEKFVGDTYVRLPKMRKGFLLYMTVRMIKSVLSVESCKIYDGQE